MMRPGRFALFGLAVAAQLALVPFGASAQVADPPSDATSMSVAAEPAEVAGPSLDCTVVGLRIMAAEVSGARFKCHVSGIQSGDATVSIRTARGAGNVTEPEIVCTGSLSGGAGGCSGSVIDRASSSVGRVGFVATLLPSGATLGPISLGPASGTASTPPMQFYPLGD